MDKADTTHKAIGDEDVNVVTYVEFLRVVPVADDDNLGHLKPRWTRGEGIENEQDIVNIASARYSLFGWHGYRTFKQITATYNGTLGEIKLSSSGREIMSGVTYRKGVLVSRGWVEKCAKRLSERARRQPPDDYTFLCERAANSALRDKNADIFIALPKYRGDHADHPIIARFTQGKDRILEIVQV